MKSNDIKKRRQELGIDPYNPTMLEIYSSGMAQQETQDEAEERLRQAAKRRLIEEERRKKDKEYGY